MKVIRLTTQVPEEEVAKLRGAQITDKHYDTVLDEDTTVYEANGDLLLVYRRNVLPNNLCRIAYENLRHLNAPPTNRGMATIGQHIPKPMLKNGKRSKTNRLSKTLLELTGADKSSSAVIGYVDRYIRFPYCRQTAFNLNEPQRWRVVLPFIRAVDEAFKETVPERYTAQKEYIDRIHPDFTINGTAFTTVTVNRNWQTTVHKDAGDLEQGFGVLTVLRGGHYSGGNLVLPEFRLGVDLRTTDVLFYNVHKWHGNSPIYGMDGTFERVSCVLYCRQKMIHCGSAKDEVKRAQHRKPGDSLNG